MMRGLFCGTTAKTNEEYKKVLRRRMNILLLVGLNGAATIVVSLFAKFQLEVTVSDRMLGLYTGVGTGLVLGAFILWIKNWLLLKNEEKLKESRLTNSDERMKEINDKAFRAAAIVLVIAMYGVALIGGIYYPILVEAVVYLIFFFILVYMIAYQIYNRRM